MLGCSELNGDLLEVLATLGPVLRTESGKADRKSYSLRLNSSPLSGVECILAD